MTEQDVSRHNVGVSLLKLGMSFAVVLVHFWTMREHPLFGDAKGTASWFFYEMGNYAVPCFMLISFFFSSDHFQSSDGSWLKSRFLRLLLPCVVWTLVSFALFSLLPPFTDFAQPTWKDLAYSVCGTNTPIGPHLWFMTALVILTAVFALFFLLVPERYRVAGLLALLVAGLAIEYSGLNHAMFKTWHHDFRSPIGRVFPMMSYACLGLIAGPCRRRWAELPVGVRALMAAVGVGAAALFMNANMFVKPAGYHYTGLKMLSVAVAIVTAAFFLPLERLPLKVRSALLFVSRYSMGIYMVHILVGRPMQNFVFRHVGLERQTFLGSAVIFAICWALCWLISLVPNRHVKGLVS